MAHRLIIIHGTDRYLLSYELEKALRSGPAEQVTVPPYEQAEQVSAALSHHLQARSFFSTGPKTVVISGLSGVVQPKNISALVSHRTEHVLIWIEYQKIPYLNKITPKITIPFTVTEASIPSYRDLQYWGTQYYKNATGQTLPNEVWPLLIKASSQVDNNKLVYSAGALVHILDKLQVLQNDGTTITSALLEQTIAQSSPITVWQWIDTLFSRQPTTRLYLKALLQQGTDALFLFNLAADHVRSLLIVSDLLSRNTPKPLITSTLAKFGKPPFLSDKLQQLYKSAFLNDQQLRVLHHKITHFDRQIKVGEIEPTMALELLLLRM